jgi:fatty acid desaturase
MSKYYLSVIAVLWLATPCLGGHFSRLYAFTGGADGGEPDNQLLLDGAGNIYGSTYLAVWNMA